MEKLKADRRLYVTADRGEIAEEGHPSGSWLLYAAGRVIGQGDIDRYSMAEDEHGRIVYRGCPDLGEPKAEPEAEPEHELTLEEAKANLEEADADVAEAEVALEKVEAALDADETGEAEEEAETTGGDTETIEPETETAEPETETAEAATEASVANGETPGGGAAGADVVDDSDRNDEAAPEWTGRMDVDKYIALYPDGPKAPLARAVIAARDDGADGAT